MTNVIETGKNYNFTISEKVPEDVVIEVASKSSENVVVEINDDQTAGTLRALEGFETYPVEVAVGFSFKGDSTVYLDGLQSYSFNVVRKFSIVESFEAVLGDVTLTETNGSKILSGAVGDQFRLDFAATNPETVLNTGDFDLLVNDGFLELESGVYTILKTLEPAQKSVTGTLDTREKSLDLTVEFTPAEELTLEYTIGGMTEVVTNFPVTKTLALNCTDGATVTAVVDNENISVDLENGTITFNNAEASEITFTVTKGTRSKDVIANIAYEKEVYSNEPELATEIVLDETEYPLSVTKDDLAIKLGAWEGLTISEITPKDENITVEEDVLTLAAAGSVDVNFTSEIFSDFSLEISLSAQE